MQGYIKLYRQMLKWEWYTNIPVRVLFGHCLLKANHKDSKWQGHLIKKGAFITSQPHLAKETGLSVMQVRTALNKLKLTGEITVNTTSQFSIITVSNWDKFQDDNSQDNSQITGEQQADNRRITTNNNDKNDKNDKNNIYTASDLFVNEHKTFFENEYKRVFKNKPYLSKKDCERILELSSMYEPQIIAQAIQKLKNLYFEKIDFKPSASWLLKENNFEKLMNGEFEHAEEISTSEIIEQLKREQELKNASI